MRLPLRFCDTVRIVPILGRDARTGAPIFREAESTEYRARVEYTANTDFSENGAQVNYQCEVYVDLQDREPLPNSVMMFIDGRQIESLSVTNHRMYGNQLVFAEVRA